MPASNAANLSYPLKDAFVAKVLLPLSKEGALELECLVKSTDPSHFEATFLPGQLPVDTLSPERICKISFQAEGHCHILNTRIVRVVSSEKLLLLFRRIKVNPFAREYFRVDVPANVCCQKLAEESGESLDYKGVINISGGGVRFPIRRSRRLGEKFQIGLAFNNPYPFEVECSGEVVRALNFSKKPYVSLKFSEIDARDRERLISFCMAVQREELRTKVQVVNFP